MGKRRQMPLWSVLALAHGGGEAQPLRLPHLAGYTGIGSGWGTGMGATSGSGSGATGGTTSGASPGSGSGSGFGPGAGPGIGGVTADIRFTRGLEAS